MRDLAEPVDDFNLVDGVDGGRKTTVDTEDFVIDYYTQREVVKHVGEVVPDIGVAVFAGTLGVETVGLCDAAGLVVAADKVDSVGVS